MKKKQGGKRAKDVKPKMSMGLEIVIMDDDNLNHEVEIAYSEMYGAKLRLKETIFAGILP